MGAPAGGLPTPWAALRLQLPARPSPPSPTRPRPSADPAHPPSPQNTPPGVCLVCYVLPVALHLMLFFRGPLKRAGRVPSLLRRRSWPAAGAAGPPPASLHEPLLPCEPPPAGEAGLGPRRSWPSVGADGRTPATSWLLEGSCVPAGSSDAATALGGGGGGDSGMRGGLGPATAATGPATVPGARPSGAVTQPSLSAWLPSRAGSAASLALSSSAGPSSPVHCSPVADGAGCASHSRSGGMPETGQPTSPPAPPVAGQRQPWRTQPQQCSFLLPPVPELPYPSVMQLRGLGAWGRAQVLALQVALPLAVLLAGCGTSLLALWLAIRPLFS